MANGGPNTNGSQFFLVYEDSRLRPDYTVFGHITEEGTHDQLLARGGAYAKLFEVQSRYYQEGKAF